jgi:hypothetical protein
VKGELGVFERRAPDDDPRTVRCAKFEQRAFAPFHRRPRRLRFALRQQLVDRRLDVAEIFVCGALGLPAQRIDRDERRGKSACPNRDVRKTLAELLVFAKELAGTFLLSLTLGFTELVQRREDFFAFRAQRVAPLRVRALFLQRGDLVAQLTLALVQAL